MTRGAHGRDPTVVDKMILGISSPLQRAFGWIIDGTASVWNGYAALRGVEAENRQLREDNKNLRIAAQAVDEARAENARLKELLAYADKNPGPKLIARV